ncbi:MAG: DNA primase [Erysipelothrix sp.]|jgi:DNA primase|nr:DNA primase [Erysipelothrix sp.]
MTQHRIDDQTIETIRQNADIVSIIGTYIPLSKKGKNHVALCPFHDDHNPSMSINASKQIYKCFVCGAGGNVFNFVSNFEKISFLNAVSKVASLSNQTFDYVEKKKDIDPSKVEGFKVLNETQAFFKYQLFSVDGTAALDYAHQRGLSDELISMFDIGYAPQRSALTTFLQAKQYSLYKAKEVNVVNDYEERWFDVFEHRLTFAIANDDGQVIGFSARALDPNVSSKYINTNTNDYYVKSDIVYNFHRAKDYARKLGYIIVVEGVMDVIAFARASIFNVVATLGTALTSNQIEKIKRLSYNVTLAYDQDEAGQAANYKAIAMLLKAKANVSVLQYPISGDPDDVIAKEGTQAIVNAVAQPYHAIEFAFKYGASLYNLGVYQQRKTYMGAMIDLIKLLPDSVDRKHFADMLSKLIDIDVSEIYKAITNAKPQPNTIAQAKRQPFIIPSYEMEILTQMMLSKEAALYFRDQCGFLNEPYANHLALRLLSYYRDHETLEVADILSKMLDEEQQRFFLWVIDWPLFPKSYNVISLDEAIVQVKSKMLDDKIKQLKQKSLLTQDKQEKAVIANEMIYTKKEKDRLNGK